MDEQDTRHDDDQGTGTDPWHDDLLDRRGFADFLGKVLVEQSRVLAERQQRGLTVALDAEWGAGKTFFIERWADSLRRQGHPVVMFDAWKHDLGEAPSIVLMAAIDEALREWFGKTSIEAATKERARELGRKGIRHFRRAVLPTAGVIFTGVLKKFTGIVAKDVRNAYSAAGEDDDDEDSDSDVTQADDESTPEAENKDAGDEDQAKIDAGLDRIFEKVLGEQSQRIEAIARFREAMGRVIDLIRTDGAARMPVFVFVDELDRCRPSYAISLLEEIKHIFGMPNVCFVVSTNLAQLSHSVRAVYGQGFDAEHYLKRFFDQTHAIPLPDSRNHIRILLADHPVLKGRAHAPGLPNANGQPPTAEDAIACIFDACRLDLRSQKQVFRIAETAASAIPKAHAIHTLWLFFLAVLVHKDQQGYAELVRKRQAQEEFGTQFAQVLREHKAIEFRSQWQPGKQEVPLFKVLKLYYDTTRMEVVDLFNKASNSQSYPDTILVQISNELSSGWNTGSSNTPSIRHYLDFVRYAGYTRPSAESATE